MKYRMRRTPLRVMPTDLVCRQDVAEDGSRFFSDYNGNMFYFCSPECKRKFDDHPDDFIRDHAKQQLGF